MRRTMVLGHVIGAEVGRPASFRELKALLILSRQTTTRMVHVIKQAKLQSLHRLPIRFRELASVRSDNAGLAALALRYSTLRAIRLQNSADSALNGYNSNGLWVQQRTAVP